MMPSGKTAAGPCRKNLDGLFKPRSVAMVGASADPHKIGHQILRNIVEGGFAGEVYPVNACADSVLGLKTFPSVAAIPHPVDFAVISIPATAVAACMEECGQKGVQAVAVITSGFAEAGNIEEEHKLKAIADRYGMALVGPNILGVVYSPSRLNATFGPRDMASGGTAFVSQSGALAIGLMGWAVMEKMGMSALVSIGNKADVDERDLIEYFNHDEHVKVTLVYMEGLKNGRDFMQTRISKPVVMLKVGRTQRGARAAASHTGSLAGSDQVFDAAFRQLGMLRADTFREAFNWARALALPPMPGRKVLIITNGGGIGVRATDECEKAGLHLLDDPEWLEETFRPVMPSYGSTKNPIDLTGGAAADKYSQAFKSAVISDKFDALLVLYCETVITDPLAIAQGVSREYEAAGRRKPVVAAMVGGERSRQAIHFLNQQGVPAFTSVADAASSLNALAQWHEISSREKDDPECSQAPREAVRIVEQARKEGRSALLEHEARQVLELFGVPVPPAAFARDLDEAKLKAAALYPLAMKIASPQIIHKSDAGGVAVNIRDESELAEKYSAMMKTVSERVPDAQIEGVNLVQMAEGIECAAGLSSDPQFGPVVMFGLGGVLVEALKDVAFRIVPFGRVEAERLIGDIKARNILDGFRGARADRPSLVQILCAIQKLAGLVKEVDINPIRSSEKGSFAVDARIIL